MKAARIAWRLAALLPAWGGVALTGLAPRRGGERMPLVVQAVIRADAGVLLSLRPELRGWELPGGNLKRGEADADALRREVREETGLDVEIVRRVGDYERTGFYAHVARVFECRVRGGTLTPSHETPSLRWFPPHALPATLFPWFRGPLLDALAGHAEPVTRREHQGVAAILDGMRIDVRMRLSDDEAA